MRLTVGPLPPAVYWRRRAVVLVGLLLALFLVSQACSVSRAGSTRDPDNAARATETPPATTAPAVTTATTPALLTPRTGAPPTPTGESEEDPSAGTDDEPDDDPPDSEPAEEPAQPADETCTDDELLVTAESEQTTFQRGQYMTFTIKFKNVSDRTCRHDVGADVQELRLVAGSGDTKVWSSDDCGSASGNDVREFVPGFERAYFVTWNGRASTKCTGGAASVPDGPIPEHGKYRLIGRLGDGYSEPLRLTLT